MPETIQVVCPDCAATNRVATERLSDQPVCGRCKQALFSGTPLELTAGNFDQHINNSDLPVLVDFWAPWCGPCRTMAPVIVEAAKTLGTRMRVAKLNTEAESAIAERFDIRSIPTLAIFRRGKIIQQRIGAADLPSLLDWARSSAKVAE